MDKLKMWQSLTFKLNVTLRSIALQNNMERNQVVLHVQLKYGDPSLLEQVIMDKFGVDTHTDTHKQTDTGINNIQKPKLASGENECHCQH